MYAPNLPLTFASLPDNFTSGYTEMLFDGRLHLPYGSPLFSVEVIDTYDTMVFNLLIDVASQRVILRNGYEVLQRSSCSSSQLLGAVC